MQNRLAVDASAIARLRDKGWCVVPGAVLSPELQQTLDPAFRRLLGLDAAANVTTLTIDLLTADLGAEAPG